jgi:hypothetical protein
VYIDANNSGNWESCVDLVDTGLPAYWANKAYMGLTATTGALADNHDVLAIKTYTNQAEMEEDDVKQKSERPFQLAEEGSVEDKIVAYVLLSLLLFLLSLRIFFIMFMYCFCLECCITTHIIARFHATKICTSLCSFTKYYFVFYFRVNVFL